MSGFTPKETYTYSLRLFIFYTKFRPFAAHSLRSVIIQYDSSRLSWTKMKLYRNTSSPIFLRRPNYLVKSVDKIKYSFPLPHWLSTAVSFKTNPLSVNQSVSQWPLQQIVEHSSIYLRKSVRSPVPWRIETFHQNAYITVCGYLALRSSCSL